jgi:hypothetical protein
MIQRFTPTIVPGGRNASLSFKPEAGTTHSKLRPRAGCMRRPSLMTTESHWSCWLSDQVGRGRARRFEEWAIFSSVRRVARVEGLRR